MGRHLKTLSPLFFLSPSVLLKNLAEGVEVGKPLLTPNKGVEVGKPPLTPNSLQSLLFYLLPIKIHALESLSLPFTPKGSGHQPPHRYSWGSMPARGQGKLLLSE